MRDMNLLPWEYRKKPTNRLLFPCIALLILSAWPAVKFGYFLPLEIKAQKEQHFAYLQEEVDRLPQLEENYQQQQAGLEELESRILAFQEKEESAPRYWQEVFCTFIDSLPSGTTIQDFTCDNRSIMLSGISSNDITSAKYLRNLENSGFFSEVRMEKIQYRNDREVSFYLSCTLEKLEQETHDTGLSDGIYTETEGLLP